MADIVDAGARSRNMAAIRGKNTKPELEVRRYLHAAGLRFRIHRKDLPGKPDLVLPAYRAAVFVHGCFWHRHPGCRNSVMPQSNQPFWREKLTRNVERDQRDMTALDSLGWHVFIVWECEVAEANLRKLASDIRALGRAGR